MLDKKLRKCEFIEGLLIFEVGEEGRGGCLRIIWFLGEMLRV